WSGCGVGVLFGGSGGKVAGGGRRHVAAAGGGVSHREHLDGVGAPARPDTVANGEVGRIRGGAAAKHGRVLVQLHEKLQHLAEVRDADDISGCDVDIADRSVDGELDE